MITNKGGAGMNRKDYALTKENLAYMGVYEPFYELYQLYREILSEFLKEDEDGKEGFKQLKNVKKLSNNNVRLLFNDFFKNYSSVFLEEDYTFHANAVFINRVDIIEIKKTKPLTLEVSFVSFPKFLNQLEWAVAFLICNKKEKEILCPFNEEIALKAINDKIHKCVDKNKLNQCMNFDATKYQSEICTELNVYSNLKNVSCNSKRHEIYSSNCLCRVPNDKVVRLPIHICKTCGKYFIGMESLKIYEKIYGKIIAIKYKDNEQCLYNNFGESELYKTGYNVKENGMTDIERQDHLKFLIETNKMKPFGIIRDLEYAINIHKYKYSDRFAVERWKRDLEYVNNYIDDKN